jgi:hypothetical protein
MARHAEDLSGGAPLSFALKPRALENALYIRSRPPFADVVTVTAFPPRMRVEGNTLPAFTVVAFLALLVSRRR